MPTTNLSLQDSYQWFIDKHPHISISYSEYYQICKSLNEKVSDWILEGNTFNMKGRLGYVSVQCFERKFTVNPITGRPNLPVNWAETKKLRAKGIQSKVVYFTDKWYCGWKWHRVTAAVRGKSAYKFEPSRTNGSSCKSGNKNKLVSLLKSDELAYTRFKYNKAIR